MTYNYKIGSLIVVQTDSGTHMFKILTGFKEGTIFYAARGFHLCFMTCLRCTEMRGHYWTSLICSSTSVSFYRLTYLLLRITECLKKNGHLKDLRHFVTCFCKKHISIIFILSYLAEIWHNRDETKHTRLLKHQLNTCVGRHYTVILQVLLCEGLDNFGLTIVFNN